MTIIDFSQYVNNVNPKIQWWLNQTVDLLVLYTGATQANALQALLKSSVPSTCVEDPDWFTRENPFYWAMEILHSGQGNVGPFWWHDSQLLKRYQEYTRWFNSLSDDERLVTPL